jgi:hypothetical protein
VGMGPSVKQLSTTKPFSQKDGHQHCALENLLLCCSQLTLVNACGVFDHQSWPWMVHAYTQPSRPTYRQALNPGSHQTLASDSASRTTRLSLGVRPVLAPDSVASAPLDTKWLPGSYASACRGHKHVNGDTPVLVGRIALWRTALRSPRGGWQSCLAAPPARVLRAASYAAASPFFAALL